MLRLNKSTGLILFILVILTLTFASPLRDYFSLDKIEELKIWIQETGRWASLTYVLIYVGAVVFCLPGSVLTLVGGLLFGVLWGTVLVTIAANSGAILTFWISRFLGHDAAKKFLRGKQIAKLDDRIASHGFYVVFW